MNKHTYTHAPFHFILLDIYFCAAFSAAILFFPLAIVVCVFLSKFHPFSCVCVSPTSTEARSNFIKTCTSIPFGHIHYIVRYTFFPTFSRRSKWDDANQYKTNKIQNKTKTAAKLMWPLLFKSMTLIKRSRERKKIIFQFYISWCAFLGLPQWLTVFMLYTKWFLTRLWIIPYFFIFIIFIECM